LFDGRQDLTYLFLKLIESSCLCAVRGMGFKSPRRNGWSQIFTVSSTNAIINNPALALIFDTRGVPGYSTLSGGSGVKGLWLSFLSGFIRDVDDEKRLPRSVSSTISGNRISTLDFHYNARMDGELLDLHYFAEEGKAQPRLRL
jgi:hypothetical protein